ncbi:MAG TPA: hypothetical protein VH143_35410 [Kofleriaceae bacterium]|jgi:hypothetical protein|nr:hypothetical protein [Kofleriaceae bacterium]
MQYAGRCHCGAIRARLESQLHASELPVRACGCSFCAKHRPRYTSDPAGHVAIEIDTEANVSRYRFGLRLADFLICRVCGVFVAAYEPSEPGRAVLNLVVLDAASEFSAAATQFADYDREDAATRSSRRARAWTPATVRVIA